MRHRSGIGRERRRGETELTISEWMKSAQEALAESGCPDPTVDARWIAEDVLHMSAAELHFEGQNAPEDAQLARMNECLRRRQEGEPVQYILRRADFMGLKLYVDNRVLIPRQDTETLVEAAVIALQAKKRPRVLDLCTGSGAIGLSIGTLVPGAEITLSDVSLGALEVARRNAHDLNVEATLRHGDLFKAVGREKFDLIASNPPYIRTSELETLQREVRFEPVLALDGGLDGLGFYRRIAGEAPKHLLPGGSLYLEVGLDEARDVADMLRDNPEIGDIGILKDLCGVERVVWARMKQE